MKLRNKKTGEVVDLSIFGIQLNIRKEEQPFYHSLAELNEEWEDYKPKEPLIKDEEVRMAVYLWALSLGLVTFKCQKKIEGGVEIIAFEAFKLGSAPRIEFPIWSINADVTDGKIYTIAELCGEGKNE